MNSADAPGELFDAYGEELIAYCWQLLHSYDATLIAVRDTLIAAQAHSRRLRDPELLGPWLFALARVECDRRAPTAAVGQAGARHPAPDGMRDEILACLVDPRQARYRAVAAARVPPLHPDGFPRVGAAAARRPHLRGLRIRGGFLPVGAAACAAVILLAAGLSLRGGGSAPGAAGAPGSASPVAAAQDAPEPAASAWLEALPVTSAELTPLTSLPAPRGDPEVGPVQQALSDVSSQQGQPAPSPAGGQPSPPIPAGMPPVMFLSGGTLSPAGSPTAAPPATPPTAALAGTVSPAAPPQTVTTAAASQPGRPNPPGAGGSATSWRPDSPGWPETALTARSCPPGAQAGWGGLRHDASVRNDLAYRYASCTITPRIIFPSSRS